MAFTWRFTNNNNHNASNHNHNITISHNNNNNDDKSHHNYQHGDFVDPLDALETLNGIPFQSITNNFNPMNQTLPTTTTTTTSTIMDIDAMHRQGWIHFGAWIFIFDNEQRLLLAKRGPSMVTCPNSWMPPGEHALLGEEQDPTQTLLRGLKEEIGHFIIQKIPKKKKKKMTNQNSQQISSSSSFKYLKRYYNLMTKRHEGLPLFYYREYGPKLDYRIDQQLTYIWIVELYVSGDIITQEMKRHSYNDNDDHQKEEMIQIQWISIPDLELWLDKQPQDFCHDSIRSFLRLVLDELKHHFVL